MFGSTILEVAIGLALMFLLLSLVASAVREGIEGIVKARAVNLERGIRELLDDEHGTGLARIVYEHPLIYSLYPSRYTPVSRRYLGRNLPTYIPARSFAVALIDLVRRGPEVGPYAAQQTATTPTVAELRASVHRIPSAFVQRAFLAAVDNAEGDMNRVRENLEAWFDSAMDRVSGWYRRRTQLHLFLIGLGIALALNVNALTVADHLWRDDHARAALTEQATRVTQDTLYRQFAADTLHPAGEARQRYADLQSLSLPIGWDKMPPSPPASADRRAHIAFWIKQLFGLLVTAFAIMLGAPFWFDTLNKFVVIRSTVKPHEKSPEESSEDRQKEPAKDRGAGRVTGAPTAAGGTDATAANGFASATATSSRATASAATVGAADPHPVPPHVDQQWANDDEDGIL